MTSKTIPKLIVLIIVILLNFIVISNCLKVYGADLLTNTEDQYMELKMASIQEVEGEERQVILEWWSYNLLFKGVDLRFSYDSTKVTPSDLQDNSVVNTSNGKNSFEFLGDFSQYMNFMVLTAENGEYRCVMALENFDDTGTYIENNQTLGYVVNSNVNGGVLIGRMSFRLADGAKIDENTFLLKTGDTSPKTGIQIAKTNASAYEDQSVFRFSLLSDDAELKVIKYDFFNYIIENNKTENLPELTYENLDLAALDIDSTDKISKYTLTLNEYLNNISLQLEKSYEYSTVKINDEEIDVTNTKEIELNKLGEADTIIDIVVTAEDKVTIHTYRLVIHRPYGTIKGSIQLGDGLRESIQESYGTYVEYIATATIYESDQFNWDGIVTKEESLDNLDLLDKKAQVETDKDDGSYTLYVIPGEYDLILERLGFLASVITKIDISAGETIELENKILFEGDTDRTGIIDLDDIVSVVNMSDTMQGDGIYDEIYDFGQKGFVAIDDLVSVVTNSDSLINIEQYTK